MAIVKNINLFNYRNFDKLNISFHEKLNIFFGLNGCGKTNILEGISLIGKGRGLRNSNLFDIKKKNKETFLIKNDLVIKNNNYKIDICIENKNNKLKKIIKVNDDLSKYSLDFLNQHVSYIIFLPEMERLFQSSPSYRRNFLDRLIFSSRNDYNKLINKYKKLLQERIKILKTNLVDTHWLNHIEMEICALGLEIYEERISQIKHINSNINLLKNDYNFQFNVELKIKDEFFNNQTTLEKYLLNIKDSRTFDRIHGGTKIGPHKSDLMAIINNDFEASQLSTGQQKTIVLMVLLSQCNYLVNYRKINPILLFDEIGSHLDSNNRQILLDMINRFNIQFFLTGTDKNLFSFVSTKAKFYNINNI